jgi:hypothetical protein
MAGYQSYTYCTSPGNFVALWKAELVTGTLFAGLAALAGAFSGGPLAILVAVVGGYVMICHIFEFLLGGKMICLGGDQCAVGRVVGIETADSKSFPENIDNDYSINLLLYPHEPGVDQATVENDGKQGFLIKEQDATKNIGMGFVGYEGGLYANRKKSAVLHCEIEGARIYNMYQAVKAAYPLLAVGITLLAIPGVGWVAGAVVILIALLILLFTWLFSDDGSLDDTDSNTGELHIEGDYQFDEDGYAVEGPYKGDTIFVLGRWVYDAGHDGWNELHPIKHLQKVNDGSPVNAPKWCEMVGETTSPLTVSNQKKKENQWTYHPLIDGCVPKENPPPVIK